MMDTYYEDIFDLIENYLEDTETDKITDWEDENDVCEIDEIVSLYKCNFRDDSMFYLLNN